MKKITRTRRFSCLLLAVITALTLVTFCLPVSATDYEYTGTVIYLSDNGNDSNDGKTPDTAKQTLAAAATAAKNGTVVVTDKYTYTKHASIGNVTLAGMNDESVFSFGLWGLGQNGPLTIKNLHIDVTYSWGFIMSFGHRLEMGENLKITKSGSATTLLSIRGGGDTREINGDTHVVLKSGEYTSVYGGTRNADVAGSTFITVYDGVKVNTVSPGNNNAQDHGENAVMGAGVVKIVGSDASGISKLGTDGTVQAGAYLDLSEYTGTVPSSWNTSGFTVCSKKGDLPEKLEKALNGEGSTVGGGTTGGSTGNTGTTTPSVTTDTSGADVIYLSDNGSDANDGKTPETPKKTLAGAIKACSVGGMVLITDKYTYGTSTDITKEITLAGVTSESIFEMKVWSLKMGADFVIKNLHINMAQSWAFILANGYDLTIDENVTVTKNDDVSSYLGIRGGADGSTDIAKDSHITIKSGRFGGVHGGTRGGNMLGNTFITIYEGATVAAANSGNDTGSDQNTDKVVKGSGVIKLVGANVDLGAVSLHKSVQGTCYLDLTEYTGEVKDKWTPAGITVIKAGEKLPDDIQKAFDKAPDVYDLSGEKNLVYISDSGNDENDGKTPETAVASLPGAVARLGESGGTVAVTDKFTYTKFIDARVPLKITGATSNSTLVWLCWGLYARNGITVENLKMIISKDWVFILHFGSPVHFGKNVECSLRDAKTYLSIRAAEKGDYASVNIVIDSGSFGTIYTGSKNGNITGDSKVEINGGSVSTICFGNDIDNENGGAVVGGVQGNSTVILRGKAAVGTVRSTGTNGGYCMLNLAEFEGAEPKMMSDDIVIERENAVSNNSLYVAASAKPVNGYPDGTFRPNNNMKISEAITVVAKVGGLTETYSPAGKTAFTDVKDSDWFYNSVMYLEEKGLLSFFGTALRPNDPITRAEFVELLSGFELEAKIDTPAFTDVKSGDAHSEAIFKAASAKLVNGYSDGTFKPEKTITRAEIVTIMNRLASKNVVKAHADNIKPFTDIDGHWARNEIVAASCDSTTDGMVIWYFGGAVPAKTEEELKTMNSGLTAGYLEGLDTSDKAAFDKKLADLQAKRVEEIRNTKTSVEVKGTKYYVSAAGNDSADGKTPETAWKSLDKVSNADLKEGDGVFFKRGDLFRGLLRTKKGVTYSAYGEGEKPKIYGSARNYSESAFWDKTSDENVYVSKETFTNDVGLIVFDEGAAWSIKKITDVGGFDGKLKADLEMFHNPGDSKLYLYSTSDPNTRFKSTEIAPGRTLVSGDGNGVVIDNLCLKYAGAHGIGYGSTENLTVENCEIGWIGGMIQYGTTRYGNAVEIYVNAKDYFIRNCYIYEVYDAGVTHQYFQTQSSFVRMENIEYSDNVITRCTYDIEYTNAQPSNLGIMKDIRIFGNILTDSGEGWGNQRPSRGDAVIKGWSHTSRGENFVITDNIISTSCKDSMLIHIGVEKMEYLPVVSGNVFIGAKGNNFGFYSKNAPKLLTYDETVTKFTVGLDNNTFMYR